MMEYPNTVQLHAMDQDLEIRVYFITPINNINAITHSGPNKICTEYKLGVWFISVATGWNLLRCLDSLKLQSIFKTSLCVKICE